MKKYMFTIFLCLLLGSLVFLTIPVLSQEQINIALHDSPWLPAFRKLVSLYEKETGVKIKLHVFPYSGLYEKLVATVTRGGKDFDIAMLDEPWVAFFYSGKYVEPLKNIDPEFEPDPAIISYKSLCRWSHEKNYTTPDGVLYALPILGNLQLFYYREDKYKEAGLSTPPYTWEDVITAAKKLHDPNKPFYGYVLRGQRGNPIVYNFLPVLRSFGGDIFVNPPYDWTVRIDDEKGKAALDFYLSLRQWCPPGVGDIGQGDIIAMLATNRALQAITVAAAYSHFDNPQESIVPFKIDSTVIPRAKEGTHATTVGVWVMGIPKGSQNKKLAFEFMKWATSKEAQMKFAEFGGVPVRSDVYRSELAKRKELRYLNAMNESFKYAQERPRIGEWYQIEDVMGMHLNKAVVGLESAEIALREIGKAIREIMKD